MIEVTFYEYHPLDPEDAVLFADSAEVMLIYLRDRCAGPSTNLTFKEHDFGWTVFVNDTYLGRIVKRVGVKI